MRYAPLVLVLCACRAPDVYTVGLGHAEGGSDFSHPREFRSDEEAQILTVGVEWHIGAERQHEEVMGQLRANQIAALTGSHTEPAALVPEEEEPGDIISRLTTPPKTEAEALGWMAYALGAALLGFVLILAYQAGVPLPFFKKKDNDS